MTALETARAAAENARALVDALDDVADFGEDSFADLKQSVNTVFNTLAPFALPPTPEHIEAIARRLSPHLWDGSFEKGLTNISLFTPEQAAASAEKRRQEKLDAIRRVLEVSAEVAA